MDVGAILPILVGVAAVMIYAGVLAFAIAQVVREHDLDRTERAVWIIGILIAPLWGAIAWYALGPHPFGLRLHPRAF